MQEDRRKTWSSFSLFGLYLDEGGSCMCRKTLLKNVAEYHGESVVILSSPGFANVMGFKSELAKSLHLEKNADDDLDYCVNRVASAIISESLALKKKRDVYHINIDKELACESVGDTTALLLSKVSPKFDNESLAIILIGNIITGAVCSQTTDLQVALGIIMRRNKLLITELYKYSVCCSYDEVCLFRYSAAVHAAQKYDEVGFGLSSGASLIHCICDNFDAEISSPNCKICVHCLAMIMAQVKLPGNAGLDEVSHERKNIKRQPMQDRSKSIKYDVQQESYDGPKKPAMPPEQALNHIPTLSFLASQAIAVQRAVENDFVFLQDIHADPKCPEYSGFNTRLCREAGMLPQPKTDVAFLPLIDRPPPCSPWHH